MPSIDPAARRSRQKRTITLIAAVLMLGGIVVLLALQRLPLPLRLLVGLGDIIAGGVLLVLLRQKF